MACTEKESEATLENTVILWKYRVANVACFVPIFVLGYLWAIDELGRYPVLFGILLTVGVGSHMVASYYWAEYLRRTGRWLWF